MPYNWTRISTSLSPRLDPEPHRNKVREIIADHQRDVPGARLVENETFYTDDPDVAYALIFVPKGVDGKPLFDALKAEDRVTAHKVGE